MISVAICTYNGEKYIEEQLNSIINQTISPNQIIICDDYSTDNTIRIAKKILEQSKIDYKIHINEKNKGIVWNFKNAINLCDGDIIFTSDQDDVWYENKIEIMMKEFKNNSNCVLVFSDAELVNKDLEYMNVDLWETLNFRKDNFKNNNYYEIFLNRCVVTGAAMAFKKDLVSKIQYFSKYWLHDGWIAINAPIYGDIKPVSNKLIKYRQHGNNVVGASKKTFIERCKVWINNINILEEVRENRFNRYNDFYQYNIDNIDEDVKNNLKECLSFWSSMKDIKYSNFRKGFKIIIKNIRNKNYRKYYTGNRGALRDVIYLIIRKEN